MRRSLSDLLRDRAQALVKRLPDERLQALAQLALDRAERLFEGPKTPEGVPPEQGATGLVASARGLQLDSTAKVLDRVARTELALLQKLEPIVEDLGRLVRLQLDEARRRLGSPAPQVIDIKAEPSDEQR